MVIEKRKFKPKQLLDLPHEILGLIFGQIPNRYLDQMKDIEQIKPYVLSRLYSSIVIPSYGNSKVLTKKNYFERTYSLLERPDDYVTDFETVESFLSVVNEYPLIRPKKILVESICVFVRLYKHYAEIFSAAKISIIPTEKELVNQDFQKLTNISCNVDEFSYPKGFISEYFINNECFSGGIDWMSRLKRVCISIERVDKEFIREPIFSNLTGSKLLSLEPEDAKYIPRNLKQLEVNVDNSYEQGLILDLPDTLESLCINYFGSRQSEINFNLAYLTNLKHLTIKILSFPDKANYEFPSSLVTLYVIGVCCSPTEREISVCPNLTAICCFYLQLNANNIDGHPFQFSNKLKELGLSSEFLMRKASEKYRNMENKPFTISTEDILPKSLQSLTLKGKYTADLETDINISDCEFVLDLSNLKYLDSFSLSANEFKIKNFPISLTKLSLYDVKKIDFKEFKNLMNLEILDLLGYSDLPDLEINSPNLMYVNFNNSKLGKITRERLKLPPSVLELKLSRCDIGSIDNSYDFPPQLQVLLLDHNKLRHPPSNLPSTLKVLGLADNKFILGKTVPRFLTSLKFGRKQKNNKIFIMC